MAEEYKNAQRTETDLSSERMGRNKLQGDDQQNVHNERQAVPDVKQETDGVIESFEKLDKEQRAREDLGKGNRSSGKPTPAVSPGEQRNPDPNTAGEGDDTAEN